MARALGLTMTPRAARDSDTRGDQRRSDPINASTVDIPDSDRIRSQAITTFVDIQSSNFNQVESSEKSLEGMDSDMI